MSATRGARAGGSGGGGGGAAGGLGGLVVATGFPFPAGLPLPFGVRLPSCGVADAPALSGIAALECPLATVGSGISPSRSTSSIHSLGVSPDAEAGSPRAAAAPLGEANADADGVAGARAGERAGGARVAHQADDPLRPGEALEHQQLAHGGVRDRARPLVAGDRECR